jgi:hypothetical protein
MEEEDTNDNDTTTYLTGFKASSVVARVIATEESRSISHFLLGEIEDDLSEEELTWDRLMPGKSANLPHDFEGAHRHLVSMYFSGEESLYTESQFRRCFRVSPALFQRIYDAVCGKGCFYPY